MAKPVTNKSDFVVRYMNGEFGNHAPSWQCVEHFLLSGYKDGPVHFRNRIAGGETHYNVNPDNAAKLARTILKKNGTLENFYVSAMAPSDKTLIQGEIEIGRTKPWGWNFWYNRQPLPMREGFAVECRLVHGLTAKSVLQHFMNPLSFDWLQHLIREYPDHVIELSVYGCDWGTVPGHNTVFWEVRKY